MWQIFCSGWGAMTESVSCYWVTSSCYLATCSVVYFQFHEQMWYAPFRLVTTFYYISRIVQLYTCSMGNCRDLALIGEYMCVYRCSVVCSAMCYGWCVYKRGLMR